MKLSLTISGLLLTLLTSVAQADVNYVTCTSNQGIRGFILEITNQELTHVKIRLYNYRLRNLAATKLQDQSVSDYTSYSVMGMSDVMNVENQILTDKHGLVQIGGYEFSCK